MVLPGSSGWKPLAAAPSSAIANEVGVALDRPPHPAVELRTCVGLCPQVMGHRWQPSQGPVRIFHTIKTSNQACEQPAAGDRPQEELKSMPKWG